MTRPIHSSVFPPNMAVVGPQEFPDKSHEAMIREAPESVQRRSEWSPCRPARVLPFPHLCPFSSLIPSVNVDG